MILEIQNAINSLSSVNDLVRQLQQQVANPPKTFAGLEFQKWLQPSNVGNDGGASAKPHGTYTWGKVPAPNGWTSIETNGASPYDNFYFYLDLGAQNLFSKFTYSLELALPGPSALKAVQAFEFELQQNVGSRIYNMAWQADFGNTKKWRYFDYDSSSWNDSGIELGTSPATIAIVAEFQRNPDYTLTHKTLSINGQVHQVGITQPSTPRVESDYLHCAVQTDTNATMTPYTIGIRNVRVDMS